MAENKADILFPGVMMGWSSKETATEYLGTLGTNCGGGYKKVLYHANTAVVANACQLMTHRYSAKVDSIKEEGGIQNIELTELEAPLKAHLSSSHKEWAEKLAGALEERKKAAEAA